MPQNLVYCPICAHELTLHEAGGRMRPTCDHCGYVHYQNPVPGVGLLIEMDGGIVLIRRGQPPHQGAWTLPSGFVEVDESAEEAAIREAEEETGLKVEIIELAGVNSFPEGPPISGIIIFFRARPVGGQLHAGDDAADARVFQPEDVPRLPFRTHREVVVQWLAARQIHGSTQTEPAEKPAYTIRPAEPRDWDDLYGLLLLIPANRDLSRETWRAVEQRFREASGVEVFVAEVPQPPQSVIIGFVALSIVRSLTEGRGLINDMAVLPTYQRQGVGAALLEAVIRRADHLDLRVLMVHTRRANDHVRAFYAALGFADDSFMCLKMR